MKDSVSHSLDLVTHPQERGEERRIVPGSIDGILAEVRACGIVEPLAWKHHNRRCLAGKIDRFGCWRASREPVVERLRKIGPEAVSQVRMRDDPAIDLEQMRSVRRCVDHELHVGKAADRSRS